MSEDRPGAAPGAATLTVAYVWSELRGQGWKLFAFPVAIGSLGAIGIGVALTVAPTFDPATADLLRTVAADYFAVLPDDRGLVVAAIVAQVPAIVTMVVALLALLVVQTGLGKRVAAGEFELLLSGPYDERDVFLALVAGSFLLVLVGAVIIVALTLGVGFVLVTTAGAVLSDAGVTLFAIGLLAPLPMGLWATFLAVVVFLVFPEAATNNSHPGNLVVALGILPALALVLASTVDIGIDPALLVVGANLVPLAGIGLGWVTVRRWFSVKRVL